MGLPCSQRLMMESLDGKRSWREEISPRIDLQVHPMGVGHRPSRGEPRKG